MIGLRGFLCRSDGLMDEHPGINYLVLPVLPFGGQMNELCHT